MPRKANKSRAFMITDVLIALAVVMILMSTLAVAVTKQNRASQKLADQRAQVRLAEEVMTALQAGENAPPAPAGYEVKVRAISDSHEIAPGMTWARVTVTHAAHVAELTGIVRVTAIPKEAMP